MVQEPEGVTVVEPEEGPEAPIEPVGDGGYPRIDEIEHVLGGIRHQSLAQVVGLGLPALDVLVRHHRHVAYVPIVYRAGVQLVRDDIEDDETPLAPPDDYRNLDDEETPLGGYDGMGQRNRQIEGDHARQNQSAEYVAKGGIHLYADTHSGHHRHGGSSGAACRAPGACGTGA